MSLRKQLIAYGLVGALNTLITATAIACLTFAGANAITANIVGFALGLANSFILNGRHTFRDAAGGSLALFLIAFAISYSANLLTILALQSSNMVRPLVSQFCGMAIYNLIFFILMKVWVFSSASKS